MKKPWLRLRVNAAEDQGNRRYMEDFTAGVFEKVNGKQLVFLAVFDGHGGREAAQYARDHLWETIKKQKEFWSEEPEKVTKAIKNGFSITHEAMWKELDKWPRHTSTGDASTSGSTATCVIFHGSMRTMYVAHVGDSGVVIAHQHSDATMKRLQATELTKDHKPDCPIELKRIEEVGGSVALKDGVSRVVWRRPEAGKSGPQRRSTRVDNIPFLAVSRALGDLWSYDSYHDDYVVSPIPDVSFHTLDPEKHKFLVLASDGLWNVFSPDDVVSFVDKCETLRKNEKWTGHASRYLVQKVLKVCQNSRVRADNTSVIVAFLDLATGAVPSNKEPPTGGETSSTAIDAHTTTVTTETEVVSVSDLPQCVELQTGGPTLTPITAGSKSTPNNSRLFRPLVIAKGPVTGIRPYLPTPPASDSDVLGKPQFRNDSVSLWRKRTGTSPTIVDRKKVKLFPTAGDGDVVVSDIADSGIEVTESCCDDDLGPVKVEPELLKDAEDQTSSETPPIPTVSGDVSKTLADKINDVKIGRNRKIPHRTVSLLTRKSFSTDRKSRLTLRRRSAFAYHPAVRITPRPNGCSRKATTWTDTRVLRPRHRGQSIP